MPASNNPITNFLIRVSKIEASEAKAVFSSFLFVVGLMSGLLHSAAGCVMPWPATGADAEVSWLWTLNFFISTAVVAVYGIAVVHVFASGFWCPGCTLFLPCPLWCSICWRQILWIAH